MNDQRIWIHLSDKPFGDKKASLQSDIDSFCTSWQSHGRKLEATGEILYHQIIIIKVDQKVFDASGCSIDKLVHFLQDIEKNYSVQLFDRTLVGYFDEEGELGTIHFSKLSTLSPKTKVFDNTITSAKQLNSEWILPLEESKYALLIK